MPGRYTEVAFIQGWPLRGVPLNQNRPKLTVRVIICDCRYLLRTSSVHVGYRTMRDSSRPTPNHVHGAEYPSRKAVCVVCVCVCVCVCVGWGVCVWVCVGVFKLHTMVSI